MDAVRAILRRLTKAANDGYRQYLERQAVGYPQEVAQRILLEGSLGVSEAGAYLCRFNSLG